MYTFASLFCVSVLCVLCLCVCFGSFFNFIFCFCFVVSLFCCLFIAVFCMLSLMIVATSFTCVHVHIRLSCMIKKDRVLQLRELSVE